jgi:hypothetical protein
MEEKKTVDNQIIALAHKLILDPKDTQVGNELKSLLIRVGNSEELSEELVDFDKVLRDSIKASAASMINDYFQHNTPSTDSFNLTIYMKVYAMGFRHTLFYNFYKQLEDTGKLDLFLDMIKEELKNVPTSEIWFEHNKDRIHEIK